MVTSLRKLVHPVHLHRSGGGRLVCVCKSSARSRPSPSNDPRLQRGGVQAPMETEMEEQNLEVVKLADADIEGVAKVEADDGWESSPGLVQTLVLGDAAALLLFAIAGRVNHGEILDAEVLATVAPFWLGWFGVASVTRAFGSAAQSGRVAPAAAVAAKTWAVATPVALLVRGVSKGYVPPMPFIIVSVTVTGVLMIGWRSLLAVVSKPEDELTPLEHHRRRKNKKGTAFEFMQLLTSLTKRW